MDAIGTETLYYIDPTLAETEARILDRSPDGLELIIDRTIFYPEGGGQPWDLGDIDGIALASVTETAGRIVHRLSSPSEASSGSTVRLRLDRGRRRDHTEQHSAQHLLSAILFKNHSIATLSFHLGSQRSTIDVDRAEFPDALWATVEDEVNAAIGRGFRYILHLCPPEDILTLPLRRSPPVGEEVIRVWEIEGLDFSPCGGTHVASTAELRLFRINAVERYKGKIRLHFSAGGRAVDECLRLHREASAASRILSVPAEELASGAERLFAKAKDSFSRAESLLGLLAARLVEASVEGSPLALDLSGAGAPGIEEGMKALKARGRFGLVSVSETATVAVVGRPGKALPPELAEAAKSLGGRGGGAPGSLRIAFAEASAASKFIGIALEILEKAEK
ncbi:MAG TPA: alanyl-tRNA editing protein [Rectinemataceae bacterium]|nr:alanyl-tRNA editing protein [Rectinemataceae bacterium]